MCVQCVCVCVCVFYFLRIEVSVFKPVHHKKIYQAYGETKDRTSHYKCSYRGGGRTNQYRVGIEGVQNSRVGEGVQNSRVGGGCTKQ